MLNMDPILKEVLKNNRTLLIRNMIPCQEFFDQLVQHNVFPGSMMYEIKTCATVDEKNGKMLELLGVRGSSVLPRFCDALQLSNHNFLADFLRDEIASRQSGVRQETNDVFRKFPKLDKLLTDQDKEELLSFLSRKMKEEVIRQGWRREPGDKEKAIDAKQRQLEESFRSKELLREKEELIAQLQDRLTDAAIELREKGLEIKHLSNYIEEIRNKNQKELDTQIHYNVANEKSLRRLTEREADVNKHLQEMITLMEQSLKKYGYKHRDARERAYAVNNIDKAKSTLYLLLKMIDEYDLIKTKCMHLLEERRSVLLLIGASTGDLEKDVEEVDLVKVVRDFSISKEDNIFKLNRELTSITDKFDEIEGKVGESDIMREMMVNLREDIIAKEEVIGQLTDENEKLKLKIAEEKPERRGISFQSPAHGKRGGVSFPSPVPREKRVSFPSPAPKEKKSVTFPSPTPSFMSGQQPKRKKTPFKQVRIKTPLIHSPIATDSDYEDDSNPSELAPTPIPQMKLPTDNGKPNGSSADLNQQQKMKLQFNLPTNHNQRIGSVLTQGMYLPPLMKQGMDFRISGPSGPMAIAKTLNAAHTKVPKKNSKTQNALGIGGTAITANGVTSSLNSGLGNTRHNGQAKVLRVSSLGPSNSNRKSTNTTQFSYQTPYGSYQAVASGVRGPPRRTHLWK